MAKVEALMGYCMKLKSKQEFTKESAEIHKTAKGAYMCKGKTKENFNMCALLSEENALKAIADGVAKKAF